VDQEIRYIVISGAIIQRSRKFARRKVFEGRFVTCLAANPRKRCRLARIGADDRGWKVMTGFKEQDKRDYQ
jgi:hypothetical protein